MFPRGRLGRKAAATIARIATVKGAGSKPRTAGKSGENITATGIAMPGATATATTAITIATITSGRAEPPPRMAGEGL